MAEPKYAADDLMYWYQLGAEHERLRIAEAFAESDAAWLSVGPQLHRDRVAERLALFERCARQVAESMGVEYVEFIGRDVRELVTA